MRSSLFLITSMLAVSACSTQTTGKASNTHPGYATAKTCITCHGQDGMKGRENVPAIGHLSYEELKARIDHLKDSSPGIPLIAHTITEEDLHQVSAYFASVNKP